jgi:hypothetical protein
MRSSATTLKRPRDDDVEVVVIDDDNSDGDEGSQCKVVGTVCASAAPRATKPAAGAWGGVTPALAAPTTQWQRELLADGFAVLPGVFSAEEMAIWRARLTKELHAFTGGRVRLDEVLHLFPDGCIKAEDVAAWSPAQVACTQEAFATWKDCFLSHSMLIQHHGVGHLAALWQLRTDVRMVNLFATLWGCAPEDLLVSFDAMSLHLPTIGKSGRETGVWRASDTALHAKTSLHTDQSPARDEIDCVQSLISGTDIRGEDATLLVLTGSHRLHAEYFQAFPPDVDGADPAADFHMLRSNERVKWFTDRGCTVRAVATPAGSVAFWFSKTFHCGREALPERSEKRLRMVMYVCMTPCPPEHLKATQRMLAAKRKAFDGARTTSHWPHRVKMFPMKPWTRGAPLPVFNCPDTDSLVLSPLERRLCGFRDEGAASTGTVSSGGAGAAASPVAL